MIQLPRRSVTRFFIPLIDVLTLLFCIFLVMPLAQSGEEAAVEESKDRQADVKALQEELDRLRKQLRSADRFPATRVLEINAKTGRLFYRDPEVLEIRNSDDAQKLVAGDRKKLGVAPGELYYLILYPRDRGSEHPLNSALDDYGHWFEGVKLKYDIPGQGLIVGSQW